MSTKVAVMNQGQLLQMDTPGAIYRRPANLFVAQFVGQLNCMAGRVVDATDGTGLIRTSEGLTLHAPLSADLPAGSAVHCAIRPEHIDVRPAGAVPKADGLPGQVQTVIFGGSWHRVEVKLAGTSTIIRAEGRGEPNGIVEGGAVQVTYQACNAMVFPAETGSPVSDSVPAEARQCEPVPMVAFL
jgi:ABC-type Fe3+/spermidine/putrescine transport system ATPase subunit